MSVGNEIKQELETTLDENKENKLQEEKVKCEREEKESIDKITSLETLPKFLATRDNSKNIVYLSDVPDVCKEQPCILGVDEAGRGPVLGPMVYGISYCVKAKEETLVDLGCADSKQLTEEKREAIFDEMNTKEYVNTCVGWAVELISPNVISMNMYKRAKCSLNELSMNSAIGLIQSAADAGVNISEVYVDTVGPPEKYQLKLQGIFPQYQITVAKKADSTYPIVSAASICAKVTRDNALKVWKFPEGLDLTADNFGSGYPGDPITKRFLADNVDLVFGFPRLVRFSWSTAENALTDTAYEVEFDEPDTEKPKYAGPKLTKFFNNITPNGEPKRAPARFFVQRHIQSCMEF